MTSTVAITEDVYRDLRDIIRERFGLYYDDNKQFLMVSRLQTRLVKRGFTDFAQYLHFLRTGAAREDEFHDLASVLSNNETYFFRESAQLRTLSGKVIDEIAGASRFPRIRLWSAACSSGEEPYSLAMTLLDSGRIAESNVTLHATDISTRVLSLAQAGVYRALSFRSTQPETIAKYFEPDGDSFRIAARVKRMVQFSQLNLMDAPAVHRFGPFDAIFCRNVLIYFDKPTQKRVVEAFARALRPRGYLFLGHSESLFHLTDLYDPILAPDSIVYRLKAEAAVR